MLDEINDAIMTQLATIAGVATVGEWTGDIEELLGHAHGLPSLHLVYAGCEYGAKEIIGADVAPVKMAWSVVVMAKSLRSRQQAAASCYGLIEAVRAALIGFDTGAGWLWPLRETLVATRKGVQVYGLDYEIDTETA